MTAKEPAISEHSSILAEGHLVVCKAQTQAANKVDHASCTNSTAPGPLSDPLHSGCIAFVSMTTET